MKDDLKICVYAICKNEEKHIDRWINSLKDEADKIVVLDTGSSDDSVSLLKKYEPLVSVYQKEINPWRFDVARNESLKLIPDDIDICLVSDLDQIIRPGWAKAIKDLFREGYTEIEGDIIDYDDNNKEISRFLSKNVHPNNPNWYWTRPIHEGLEYHGKNPDDVKIAFSPHFIIEHHPDRTKSRGNYLNLLELEYEENSLDPLCAIYYGCELEFNGRYDESFQVFLKAQEECDYTGKEDIYYRNSLNIALGYIERGDFENALKYTDEAYKTGYITRELYNVYIIIYDSMNDKEKLIEYINKSITCPTDYRGWIENSVLLAGGNFSSVSHYFEDYENDLSRALVYKFIEKISLPDKDYVQNDFENLYNKYREVKNNE